MNGMSTLTRSFGRVACAYLIEINVIGEHRAGLSRPRVVTRAGMVSQTAHIRLDEHRVLIVPEHGGRHIADEYPLCRAIFLETLVEIQFLVGGGKRSVKVSVAIADAGRINSIAGLQEKPVLRMGVFLLPGDELDLR